MNNGFAVVTVVRNRKKHIHEWIHHYIAMGFAQIYIAIHSSTDDTLSVIQAASKQHSQVRVVGMDWLHKGVGENKNSRVESYVYAYVSDFIRRHHSSTISNILYVDSNEFWYPRDITCDAQSVKSSFAQERLSELPVIKHNDIFAPFSAHFKPDNQPSEECRSILPLSSVQRVKHFGLQAPSFDSENPSLPKDLLEKKNDLGGYILQRSDPNSTVEGSYTEKNPQSSILNRTFRKLSSKHAQYGQARDRYAQSLKAFAKSIAVTE